MSEPRCYVCGQSESDDPENVELRPYGEGGKPICFDCMTADPAREAEAQRQFGSAMEAASGGIGPVVIGDGGPPRAATFEEASLVASVLPGLPKPSRG